MIRRIHFDDRFYWTMFSFLVSLCSLILLTLFIDKLPIWGYIILLIIFSLFLAGISVFFKMGISFNYRTQKIKYLGHYAIKRSSFSMNEVAEINFCEIPTPKSSTKIPPKEYIIFQNDKLDYVYKNGKIYKFTFFLTNGEVIEIPYLYLFKSYSERRVRNQEKRIHKIIGEFNEFALKNT